jgi:hypothetical protein
MLHVRYLSPRTAPGGTLLLVGLILWAGVSANLQAADPVSSKCPHVRILTRGDRDLVEPPYDAAIINPRVKQKKALAEALDSLPPVVCQSVQMVVFLNATLASAPEALAWVGKSRPSLINISAVQGGASEARLTFDLRDIEAMSPENNAARKASMVKVWPEVVHSIIHEAYHSATHLIDSFSPDAAELAAGHDWPAEARQFAEPFVEKARVRGGFRAEWARMNEEFEDENLSGEYDGARVGRAEAPPIGFMTIYAGKSPGEDIAETASWAIAQPILRASVEGAVPDISEWRIACTDMQAHDEENIPSKFAALYTKLNFLRDVGFITNESLDECAGPVRLEGADGSNGFHYFSYQSGAPLTSYTTDFSIQREPDALHISAWGNLQMQNESRSAVTKLQIWVDDPALPRGLYAIGQCNDFVPRIAASIVAPAMFRRDVMDIRSQSICAYQAMVLVTSATTDQIEGVVVLQKAWKFSAPPVPEVGGFPVRVVFVFRR